MALKACLHGLSTQLRHLFLVERRRPVILWRLCQPLDIGEAVCSITEPSLGVFDIQVTHNGRVEVRRVVHDIDMLMSWSENVKACLHARGWQDVNRPERFPRGVRAGRDHASVFRQMPLDAK
jgi:hypothetical protein